MNNNSQAILHGVEENDTSRTKITLGDASIWHFRSSDRDDYKRLGVAIGNNIHLTELRVFPSAVPSSDVVDDEFYDGLTKLFSS